jgi:DNA-binding transcriptional ArsR family regulator
MLNRNLATNELASGLDLPPTRLSQHLAVLRSLGLVELEPIGQKRVYRLAQPRLALWLIEGIAFVAHRMGHVSKSDVQNAKHLLATNTAFPASFS